MKKLARYFVRLFSPRHLQDIDMLELMHSLNSETVRKIWLHEVYEELRSMNLGVEKALLAGDYRLHDLSARRKAFQDVLELLLNARKRSLTEKDPNPRFLSEVDMDRVTV